MRKVFLDELPRHSGKNNKIDWKKSIGYKIKFIYEKDFNGEVEIVAYKSKGQRLKIKYNDDYLDLHTSSFMNCLIGNLLGTKTLNYKYKIGEVVDTITGKIKILEHIRLLDKNSKAYKYLCLIDNNIDTILEYQLTRGGGCNVCNSRKVLKNHNDLWYISPKTAQLLKYPERGYQVSYGSNNLEIFVCPRCKYEKPCRVRNVFKYGFPCLKCGDGISFPNKFAFSLLDQLCVNFMPEYNFFNFRFDFYFEINNKKYAVEMDGRLGHGNVNKLSGQTAEETKLIDENKDKLAQKNNIEVIRIDSLISDFQYLKINILNSKLAQLFDLNTVNWDKCYSFALSSRVLEASNLWNSGIKNVSKILEVMKLSRCTVIIYLNRARELGWCDYDPKKEQRKSAKNTGSKNKKSIIQLTLDNNFIIEWDSIINAQNDLNIKHISDYCKNRRISAGGFKWMYKEDYEQYINNKNIINE
jgi:hypothetical protein